MYDFRRCGTAGGKEIGECADTQGERERERENVSTLRKIHGWEEDEANSHETMNETLG